MFFLFLLLSIISFTIPGIYILRESEEFNFWEKMVFGTVLGFTLFTLVCYFLVVLNISFMILPIIFLVNFFALGSLLKFKNSITFLPKDKLLILSFVLIIGVIGQLAIIAPSGLIQQNGNLIFFSSNGHDGPWHIALMEELKKGYPLQNPAFAQEKLVNYHFFSDIAPAFFNKFFFISEISLYFRYFPLLYSILLGSAAYLLGKKLGGNFSSGIWSVFFTLFAGSFGFIVTWLKDEIIGGEGIFWATQIQSSNGNPPQIVSDIIVLTILFFLFNYLNKKRWIIFFCLVLLIGTLAVFKVYASIVVLGALILVGIWQLFLSREISILLISIFSGLLSALLLLPNSAQSAGFLIFEPWWYIRTMVVSPDRLDWLDMEHRRQTYIFENNLKRVIQLEGTAFLIYFFGNLGLRFLGIWQLLVMIKEVSRNYFNQVFLLIIIISFIMPLLFLQKGVASNTIQFMQYFLLLMGILAGILVSKILSFIKLPILKFMFCLLIIILSVPTQIGLIYSFYNHAPLAKISSEELKALSFLKKESNDDAVILTPSFNKYYKENNPTPNIWAWSDSAYVAAFSGRRTYLSDLEQVDIMGYKYKPRLEITQSIFTEKDPEVFVTLLKSNKIDYIYFPPPLKPAIDLEKTVLQKVYSQKEIEIWKVN